MTRTGKLSLISALGLFVFLFCGSAVGEIKVQSLVDRNTMSVGETFRLEVRVSSDKSVPMSQPRLPTISGVDLINRSTRQESRSSLVATPQGMDFKNITTKVYQYDFVVQKEGKVNIEPIVVEAGGKKYSTKPIILSVSGAGAGSGNMAQQKPAPPRPRGRPGGSPQDPFSRMEEQFNNLLRRHFGRGGGAPDPFNQSPGGFATPPKNKNFSFFITAEVDKTEAYEGEQITAAWYLYTQGTVRDIDTLKYPTLRGFWKEDIQIATHLNFESEVVNGLPYKRALLASYALFPIKAGKKKIDSYKAKATILRGFGFTRSETQTRASDIIPIIVKPLPTEGRPPDFTGAVGNFQMKATVDDRTVIADQPFTLKIRFDGIGNAKLIELPKLDLPDGVELYDVKKDSKFFKNGQSFKQFEVLLIPRQAGELTLPQLTSSYFDPKQGKYLALSTEPVTVNILKGAKQASIGDERLKSDGPIKKVLPGVMTEFNPNHRASRMAVWPWLLGLLFSFLLLIGRTFYELGWFSKAPDIRDQLKTRMSSVHHKLDKKKYRDLGIEMTNCVYYVLGEVSGQGGANVELEKLLAKTAPSIRREIEVPLRKLMDYFGVLGFGPKSVLEDRNTTKDAKKNVKAMEDLLNKAIKLSRKYVEGDDD